MSNDNEDVMGTREAAETLGVSVRTVQLWVENGSLRAWKTPGKHRRILRSSVDDLLAERDAPETVSAPRAGDILIVEDEITMQTYYQALFELLWPKAPLRFASDGFAGLVEYGRSTPRLMLADIDMPGMDGIEMIRSLSTMQADDVHVVVVTGLSDEQISARGGLPPSVPVYAKPLGADALQQILAETFGQEIEKRDGETG
jgi:excisionase family DNA binding protein